MGAIIAECHMNGGGVFFYSGRMSETVMSPNNGDVNESAESYSPT